MHFSFDFGAIFSVNCRFELFKMKRSLWSAAPSFSRFWNSGNASCGPLRTQSEAVGPVAGCNCGLCGILETAQLQRSQHPIWLDLRAKGNNFLGAEVSPNAGFCGIF